MINNLSLVQNYACFDKHRVGFVLDNLYDFSKILNHFKVKSLVNYNTNHYYPIIKDGYKKFINDINFENDLGDNWCEIIENLLLRVETEYVMCLCEDFLFSDNLLLWEKIMNEAFLYENADYLHLGEIHKQEQVERKFEYDKEFCRYYTPFNTVHTGISLDGIHKTSNLLSHIRTIKNHQKKIGFNYSEKKFHTSRMNFPERFFREHLGGLSNVFETSFSHFTEKKYLCAWPKSMITTHATYIQSLANHNFKNYNPKNSIAIDFLNKQQ